MNMKEVFNALLDNIESDHGMKSFAKGLYETQLIRPTVSLGYGDTRTEFKEEISQVNLDATAGRKSLRISKVDLAEIYRNKQNRLNKIFYLSLITIGITIVLIIIGSLIVLINKSQLQLGIITSLSSMMTGIIGGTTFWLHRFESNRLIPVEQDIMKIDKLESFLEMIQTISDKEQRINAYKSIIRQMGSQSRTKDSAKKILILSANPEDTSRLRLDEEVREIEGGLKRAKLREQFDIKSIWAVRFEDIRQSLLDYEPQIVHFSGHGDKQDGLMVESELGIAVSISPEALSGLLKLCSHHVECVILNACYSATQAVAIKEHINYVIGMPEEIMDKAAIEFAVGFYDALGSGRPVEDAFKFGYNAILQKFPDLPKKLFPLLEKRNV